MTRLLRAETHRWLARRSLWFTLMSVFAIAAMIWISLVNGTQPPSGPQVEQAKVAHAREHADWVANHEQYRQDCLDSVPAAEAEEACQFPEPQLDWFIMQPIDWEAATQVATVGGAVVGALGALMMAASFWGAEYRHGSLSTWLTYVPSRGRVWASKMFVGAGFGAVVTGVVALACMLVAWAAVALQQGPAAVGAWWTPLLNILRGVGFGVLTALLGAALATLFRNTVAAVAVPLGYMLLQGLFGILAAVPGYVHLQRWLPENNIRAFIEGGLTYDVSIQRMTPGGLVWDSVRQTISFGQGAAYLIVLVGLFAVASVLVFLKRDVTD